MARDIITHRIPKIEIFEVAEYELDQIDGSCRLPERYLAFCTGSLAISVSLVIAWVSEFGAKQLAPRAAPIIFGTLAIAAAILSVITGVMWFRLRKHRADVIQRIRDRRVDPGLPEQAE